MKFDVFKTARLDPSKPHLKPGQLGAVYWLPDTVLAPLVLVVLCQQDEEAAAEILHTDALTIRDHANAGRAILPHIAESAAAPLRASIASWEKVPVIITRGDPAHELERGLSILYAMLTGSWSRMDFYNGSVLTGLVTKDWTWQKDAGFA